MNRRTAYITRTSVLLPNGPTLPVAFRTMNPMPVSYTEFPVASRDYPLVFISSDQGRTFMPMLVLGLAPRQNLFVTPANAWDSSVYLPAYVRRYPFCMTRIPVDFFGQTGNIPKNTDGSADQIQHRRADLLEIPKPVLRRQPARPDPRASDVFPTG